MDIIFKQVKHLLTEVPFEKINESYNLLIVENENMKILRGNFIKVTDNTNKSFYDIDQLYDFMIALVSTLKELTIEYEKYNSFTILDFKREPGVYLSISSKNSDDLSLLNIYDISSPSD